MPPPECCERLCWIERGGPPIGAAPQRRGFGTRVLDTTIRQQLGGSATMAWLPTGLTCTIEIPLARVTRSSEEAPLANRIQV